MSKSNCTPILNILHYVSLRYFRTSCSHPRKTFIFLLVRHLEDAKSTSQIPLKKFFCKLEKIFLYDLRSENYEFCTPHFHTLIFFEFFYTSRSALGRPKVRTDEQSGMSASVCQTPATDLLDECEGPFFSRISVSSLRLQRTC